MMTLAFKYIAFSLGELTGWGWFAAVAGIGGALGLIIAYFASREYIRQTIATLKETITSQEKSLAAKDMLALSLADTHKQDMLVCEEKFSKMEEERNKYRQQLHDLRELYTPLQLEVQELKLRPNLKVVLDREEAWHTKREEFYQAMSHNQATILSTQEKIVEMINKHDDALVGLLEQILAQLKSNSDANTRAAEDTTAAVEKVGEKAEEIVHKAASTLQQ